MRTLLLTLLLVPMMSFGQNVYIPDANFKAYLVGEPLINTNGDSEIQVSEASAFTGTINCIGLSISELTGIEAFTALTILYCGNNQLTTLDVSGSTALEVLHCPYNYQLTTLNVSGCTALEELYCFNNQLTYLNVSTNTSLTHLKCKNNQLTYLNVSNNIALIELWCHDNQLTYLNVSNNIALIELWCHDNQLTSLDLSNNSNLIELYCSNNQQLQCLNVKNGNYFNFIFFVVDNNPNLTCIEVDNVNYSTVNWTNIDPQHYFNSDCGNSCAPSVYIPDANFKNCLVNSAAINTNGDSEIQVSEASAFTGYIGCGTMGISDLTGIEAFTNLTELYCMFNQLTSLDVSNNIALTSLTCWGNQLTSLDVSNNTALTSLSCWNNGLTSLDLSNNTALTSLSCYNNQLECLNVKNGNNMAINNFFAQNNPNLTCIEVDDINYSAVNWTNIDPNTWYGTDCNNACSNTSSISELNNTPKQLIKIVDLLGRETPFKHNTPLLYIYNDGTVERKMIIKE